MTHDLLHDPLIQSDRGWHSLPGLLAAMARGEVAGFPALRPHQRPAWHMFLVQLSVMALDAAGGTILPKTEEEWRAALSALTPDFPDGEPWHLVVPDRSRPAFLQPPDPGGLKWSEVPTPDALDMLITSRNHEVKREIAHSAAPQDWVFALVSVQTMEGYKLKYSGIVRMASGASSRVMLGLAPPISGTNIIDISRWWQRDVTILLADAQRKRNGIRLLWVEPWPDGSQLPFDAADTLFIEICRRARLEITTGALLRTGISTALKPRVQTTDWTGNSGDPWAPVTADTARALTLGERDFDYKLLAELITGRLRGKPDVRKWERPLLLRERDDELTTKMLVVAEGFARGAGGKTRTDGFRSRVIPVPKAELLELLWTKKVSVAEEVIRDIADVSEKLHAALFLVASSGDDEKAKKNKESLNVRRRLGKYTQPAVNSLERQADNLFFPELWQRVEVKIDDDFRPLRLTFLQQLATIARREFDTALPSIPCASLMRRRAEVRGRARLESGLARLMRDLKPKEETHA